MNFRMLPSISLTVSNLSSSIRSEGTGKGTTRKEGEKGGKKLFTDEELLMEPKLKKKCLLPADKSSSVVQPQV